MDNIILTFDKKMEDVDDDAERRSRNGIVFAIALLVTVLEDKKTLGRGEFAQVLRQVLENISDHSKAPEAETLERLVEILDGDTPAALQS